MENNRVNGWQNQRTAEWIESNMDTLWWRKPSFWRAVIFGLINLVNLGPWRPEKLHLVNKSKIYKKNILPQVMDGCCSRRAFKKEVVNTPVLGKYSWGFGSSQIVLRSGMNASRIHQALSEQVLTSSLNHQVMTRVLLHASVLCNVHTLWCCWELFNS